MPCAGPTMPAASSAATKPATPSISRRTAGASAACVLSPSRCVRTADGLPSPGTAARMASCGAVHERAEQIMRQRRNGPRQPGGGKQTAGPRGRGHGRDRDERIKERSNPRQSELRVKHAPKREGGRGRAFPAHPPREQPVAFQPAPPPVLAPKLTQFSAGVQTVTVTPDEAGMRVDRFFEARFPGLSFSHIQRIIRKGEVRVNGKRTQPKNRLEAGQTVRIPPLRLDQPKSRAPGSEA